MSPFRPFVNEAARSALWQKRPITEKDLLAAAESNPSSLNVEKVNLPPHFKAVFLSQKGFIETFIDIRGNPHHIRPYPFPKVRNRLWI